MKIRQGRKNGHNLYLQLGEEPDDADPCLGLIIDPEIAKLIAESVTSPWHLNKIKLEVGIT